MTLHLTPEMLAHAYEYLCCQPPFSKWNLPPSEDIKFGIIRQKDRFAHYQMRAGVHHIEFVNNSINRHEQLISTMAHEMIHLHAEATGIASNNPHDKAFHKFADRICKIHEFDRSVF